MKKNNIGNILIVVLFVLVLGLTGYIIYDKMYLDKNNPSENNPNNPGENNPSENEQNVSKLTLFSIDIDNWEDNKEVLYKINDLYTVKLIIKEDSYSGYTYDIYVNDVYFNNDTNFGTDSIKFYAMGDYLLYKNTGFTNIRREHLYIFDKNVNITDIYELDNIKGMVPEEIQINADNIVIKGTRLTHGISIVYDKAVYEGDAMLEDSSTWVNYGITENTIIKSTYTYNLQNGVLNLTPVVSDEISIKDYLSMNN